MKVLILDNYDSFTYNLVQLIKMSKLNFSVYRNDEIDLDAVDKFDKILLSPGPGIPDDAGIMKDLINRYYKSKSILGICLGMQAIAEVFGCEIYNMKKVYHAESCKIKIKDKSEVLFKDINNEFFAGRYHSWAVKNNVSEKVRITAVNSTNLIMGIKHKKYDVKGLQFHPESILTEKGEQIIKNWINN